MKLLRLAADTNVLLDLTEEVESVLDTLAVLEGRLPESDIVVVPSVLEELAFLSDSGDSPRIRKTALRAITMLRQPGRFRPLLDLPVPPALVEEVAREVRFRKLLPEEEVHDSLILAETAFAGCGLLLTSDEHLRAIDHEHLTLVLNAFELVPPVIATPGEIVKKFFR
jgi:predicted nucleic acid-binding protein